MYRFSNISEKEEQPTENLQTTDSDRPIVDGVQEPPQLKIEIPANRYARTTQSAME